MGEVRVSISVSLPSRFRMLWVLLQLMVHSLDVILIRKNDDAAGIGGLHQSLDQLVKLARSGFSWDLDGLGDTDST